MKLKLYVVHGSHPCRAVETALRLKGLPYRRIELVPPLHAPIQRLRFGVRTVPALSIDGEKLSGSRAIMRRLDELAPEPALYPADPDARARVEEAERWGDEVLQPLGRRLVWPALRRAPRSIPSYQEGSSLPLPGGVTVLLAPVISRVEIALNGASDDAVRDDLAALPGYLDHVDALIAEGVIGGGQVNAADLQIATTLRLLMTLDDLRPIIEPRPAGAFALRIVPEHQGNVPAGTLPAEWLPPTA